MEYKAIDKTTNEYKAAHRNTDEIFDIFKLNMNERTRTAFTQKINSYMEDAMQTTNFIAEKIIKELERLED